MRYKSISRFVIFYNRKKGGGGLNMRLKDMREDRDITQKEIAEFLHIKQNTYSQYETGQRQLPVDTLIKLALFFNTSTDYILELTDEAKPYRRTGR